MSHRSVFWDDLAGDRDDPEFFNAYVTASLEIAAADARTNAEEPGPAGPRSS
jgi:hypothetical protein